MVFPYNQEPYLWWVSNSKLLQFFLPILKIRCNCSRFELFAKHTHSSRRVAVAKLSLTRLLQQGVSSSFTGDVKVRFLQTRDLENVKIAFIMSFQLRLPRRDCGGFAESNIRVTTSISFDAEIVQQSVSSSLNDGQHDTRKATPAPMGLMVTLHSGYIGRTNHSVRENSISLYCSRWCYNLIPGTLFL